MHLKTKNWGEAIMICLLSMKKRGGNTHLQLSNFDKGGGGFIHKNREFLLTCLLDFF